MQPDRASTLEERLTQLEQSVADIAARLDAAPSSGERLRTTEAPPFSARQTSPKAKAPRAAFNPFAKKSAEWWLARVGAVLTSLALILLYQYAVERNWLTPLVRVLLGTAVGAVLMISASKLAKRRVGATEDVIGLREGLLGAALSAWYITAYAAAVFYQLIPFSTARLLFLALTILGAWIALSERRAILGLLALGVGFWTPQLLPSVTPFVPAFTLFLAALTAVGLVLYLVRGWQSILWLTFIGFWFSALYAVSFLCCTSSGIVRITGSPETARIAIALLVIVGGAAMTRVPTLRRKLLALESPLYTQPTTSAGTSRLHDVFATLVKKVTGYPGAVTLDTPALWMISLSSPLVGLFLLGRVWGSVPSAVWGIVSLLLAVFAGRLVSSKQITDEEVTHVAAAATVLLSLSGVMWIAGSIGNHVLTSSATILIAASLHALAVLYYLRESRFVTIRRIGLATAGVTLMSVVMSEVMLPDSGPNAPGMSWTLAEMAAVGVSAWIWWMFRRRTDRALFPSAFGIGIYIAFMLIDARVLAQLWLPLVTASYAIAGTAMLILARGKSEARGLGRVGAITLVLVVTRLMIIDLAAVETIWRVLLFLGCGALFLLTSHVLQSPQESSRPEPAS